MGLFDLFNIQLKVYPRYLFTPWRLYGDRKLWAVVGKLSLLLFFPWRSQSQGISD